jgi:ribosomal protein S21
MELRRKPKENISMFLRRFTQKVRESRILVEAKKARFHRKKPSRIIRRKSALERVKRRKERTRLKKLGRL